MFAALAGALTARGFSAPRIFEADLDQGFLIIEDLTDALFARLIPAVAHEGALYATAVETLGAIYRSSFERQPTAFGKSWTVQDYDALALHAETALFTDWYAPWRGKTLSEADKSDWRNAWSQVLPHLEAHAPGLVLRDFHAENLIWLPQREHEAKVDDAPNDKQGYKVDEAICDTQEHKVDEALYGELGRRLAQDATRHSGTCMAVVGDLFARDGCYCLFLESG